MLIGEYQHNLDAKGRIIVPAKLREEIGDKMIVTRGLDENLYVYAPNEFQTMINKIMELPQTSPQARRLRAVTIARAVELEVDVQGRINLPAKLIESAKLSKRCVIVGNIDHLEIWDEKIWDDYYQMSSENISEFASNLII